MKPIMIAVSLFLMVLGVLADDLKVKALNKTIIKKEIKTLVINTNELSKNGLKSRGKSNRNINKDKTSSKGKVILNLKDYSLKQGVNEKTSEVINKKKIKDFIRVTFSKSSSKTYKNDILLKEEHQKNNIVVQYFKDNKRINELNTKSLEEVKGFTAFERAIINSAKRKFYDDANSQN